MPRIRASCRASSVFPTPVGPVNTKLPIGLSGDRSPDRDSLIADATSPIALSCPKITLRSSVSSVCRARRSSRGYGLHGHPGHLGHHLLDLLPADGLRTRVFRQELLRGAGLVDHIDRLVGQVQILQVLRRQRDRTLERRIRVRHTMVRFVVRTETLENLDRLVFRRLEHIDFLEAARQTSVLVERLLHIAERRRTDAAKGAVRQRWLQETAGIHGATRSGARADQGMNLIDEEDGVRLAAEPVEHLLHALFEVAAIAGAGEQRPEVERVHLRILERIRYVAFVNLERQTLGKSRLANTGLPDQQRIVLSTPAEHLNHSLELQVAADERIDLPSSRPLHEIGRVGLERVDRRRRSTLTVAGMARFRLWSATMRDHV